MAKFSGKCPNQVITMVPNQIIVNQGVVQNVIGKRIVFENGNYETTDKKEIEFIKNHRLFGFGIVEVNQKDQGAGE